MPADAPDRADVLTRMCAALARGDAAAASTLVRTEYPFVRSENAGRAYTEVQSMRLFVRDCFTDRYTGARLVFPGTLRLLSRLLPSEFPFHANWKMTETHVAFWELFPTVDHVVPVARGGRDDDSNWVTTSMLRNSAKSNWSLDELGWQLHTAAPDDAWDGLVGFCFEYLTTHPEHLADKYIARWHRAAKTILET